VPCFLPGGVTEEGEKGEKGKKKKKKHAVYRFDPGNTPLLVFCILVPRS